MAYTLPGNDAKMLRYKRCIFNAYLSYINYQSENDFLFQECTLFEAAIWAKSNAVWDVVQYSKYKSKWMLEKKSNYNNMNSSNLKLNYSLC